MTKNNRVTIIGAGISGLAMGQMLKDNYDVTIFEGASRPGGLIKCERVNGNLYHTTGGHVFNTKRKDVLDWFWSFFNKEAEFTKAKRNASIYMDDNNFVPYPIENYIHFLKEEQVKNIIKELLLINKSNVSKSENFKEFLKSQFGDTLYELYFRPYNEKIWQCDLSEIPLSWLEGKLPMPTVHEILYNNIKKVEESNFVHSSFYYPHNNGSQFIVDRLSQGLDIRNNTKIEVITKEGGNWNINGMLSSKVVYTGNIKQLPTLLAGQIDISEFVQEIENLEFHGTTTVLCELETNPYSWVYIPNPDIRSHRIICTGNFAESNNSENKMSATIEFTDHISLEEINETLKKLPFAPKYLAHHYEKFTYPIQNKNTREMIIKLKTELAPHNFHLLGRFAEWEYYNMDMAIGATMDLISNL